MSRRKYTPPRSESTALAVRRIMTASTDATVKVDFDEEIDAGQAESRAFGGSLWGD